MNLFQEIDRLNQIFFQCLQEDSKKYSEIVHYSVFLSDIQNFKTKSLSLPLKVLNHLAKSINEHTYNSAKDSRIISSVWCHEFPELVLALIKKPFRTGTQKIYYLPSVSIVDKVLPNLTVKEQTLLLSSTFYNHDLEPISVFHGLIGEWENQSHRFMQNKAESANQTIANKLYQYHKALKPSIIIKNQEFLEDILIEVGLLLDPDKFQAVWQEVSLKKNPLRRFKGLQNFLNHWTFQEDFSTPHSIYLRKLIELYQKEGVNFNLPLGYPHNAANNNLLELILFFAPNHSKKEWVKWGEAHNLNISINGTFSDKKPLWFLLIQDTDLLDDMDFLKINLFQKDHMGLNLFSYLATLDNPKLYIEQLVDKLKPIDEYFYDLTFLKLAVKYAPASLINQLKKASTKNKQKMQKLCQLWQQELASYNKEEHFWQQMMLTPVKMLEKRQLSLL